jgi:hypothetical protein
MKQDIAAIVEDAYQRDRIRQAHEAAAIAAQLATR